MEVTQFALRVPRGQMPGAWRQAMRAIVDDKQRRKWLRAAATRRAPGVCGPKLRWASSPMARHRLRRPALPGAAVPWRANYVTSTTAS